MALVLWLTLRSSVELMDVDLGNATAERLCLKMNFLSAQFATMIPMLKERRTDMINSFMFYTPEGASQVMVVPYGASAIAIVVPKTNTDAIGGREYFPASRLPSGSAQ